MFRRLKGMGDQNQRQQTTMDTCRKASFAAAVSVSPTVSAAAVGGEMDIIRTKEFGPTTQTAVTEAVAAFKNGDVYVEKYVEHPRHIAIHIPAYRSSPCPSSALSTARPLRRPTMCALRQPRRARSMVCIIEAMKLMNKILAEISVLVERVYVEEVRRSSTTNRCSGSEIVEARPQHFSSPKGGDR